MLTAHFVNDESIAIELPQAESSTELNSDEVLELIITSQEGVLLQGKEILLTELEAHLFRLLQKRENKELTLRGDRNTHLEKIVAILDIARKAGADAVAIMTQKP